MLKSVKYEINQKGLEVNIECETIKEMARFRSAIESYAQENILYLEFKSYNDKEYQSKEFDTIVIEEDIEFLIDLENDLKEVIQLAKQEMEIVGYWE